MGHDVLRHAHESWCTTACSAVRPSSQSREYTYLNLRYGNVARPCHTHGVLAHVGNSSESHGAWSRMSRATGDGIMKGSMCERRGDARRGLRDPAAIPEPAESERAGV